ncbi:Bacterial actin-related protein [subsurface metagenome]
MSTENKNQLRPIIIEIGSQNFRLGWAGDDYPDIITPSVYVDNKDYLFTSDVIDGLEDIFITEKNAENHLFGHEALKYSNILKIHFFKKESNYNIFMKYFYHHYKQLNIAKENHFKQPIIIITPFFISELEKTKLQDIFFNVFDFPSLLFLSESQGILATLRKTSGVVINMGEANTTITTFLHGFSNAMARDIYPIAGKELTSYLLNLILTRKGSGKTVYLDKILAKEIKDKLSLCIFNLDEEIRRIKDGLTKYNRTIDLPDGSSLEINTERFMLVEPLFNPSLIHIDYLGLPEVVSKVIKFWDRENWEIIVSNIIIAGGGSLIPGLEKRLKLEIAKYFSDRMKEKINVVVVSGRENIGWIGGSVLWAQDKLKKGWIQNPNHEAIDQEHNVEEPTQNDK